MKPTRWILAALLVTLAVPGVAQQADRGELGEVLVSANRGNARYAQQERPVIGLQRPADAAVMAVAISSDSRDPDVRRKEIHSVLLAALDRGAAAGVELVSGGFQISPVTKANYADCRCSGVAGRTPARSNCWSRSGSPVRPPPPKSG